MKVYTFWIHGLGVERSSCAASPLQARKAILDALSAAERQRVGRLELVDEAPADEPRIHIAA